MSTVAEKVMKLLAKAERTENEHERDAYNAAAQRLIIENEIDEASLLAAGKERTEKIAVKSYVHKGAHQNAWSYMTFRIAHALGLKTITSTTTASRGVAAQKTVHVYGYESDLSTFDLLLASLTLQETNAVWTDWKRHRQNTWKTDQTAANRFKKSHILAFGIRVAERIVELKREINKEKVVPGSSTALVLVDKAKAVEAFFNAAHPSTRKGRGIKIKSRDGYGAGTSAGNRADIGQGRVSNRGRAALV